MALRDMSAKPARYVCPTLPIYSAFSVTVEDSCFDQHRVSQSSNASVLREGDRMERRTRQRGQAGLFMDDLFRMRHGRDFGRLILHPLPFRSSPIC